jgi:hypothetical protein
MFANLPQLIKNQIYDKLGDRDLDTIFSIDPMELSEYINTNFVKYYLKQMKIKDIIRRRLLKSNKSDIYLFKMVFKKLIQPKITS